MKSHSDFILFLIDNIKCPIAPVDINNISIIEPNAINPTPQPKCQIKIAQNIVKTNTAFIINDFMYINIKIFIEPQKKGNPNRVP